MRARAVSCADIPVGVNWSTEFRVPFSSPQIA